ncbi:hypothetical protein AWM75_04545 [Aerococcus urinaehominis]|uniref:Uncharacterized protein n=1 Tax=Aerococcus urinaehominis TaxID=128944 RepID=A0A0X8FL41_9LACT|nr:threonine/serine exporter family protein [Aerococcus urinaehominis]AMB99316.1 hypothetical protein AWM75_04545 [Aerococcus urinaehominis]SDM20014.1 Uncharacterized membrane protein YjjB, DUF3815 family [Aerococcus urinaehominis]
MTAFIIQLIGALFVGIFCGINVNVPTKLLKWVPIIDVAGWAAYLILINNLNFSVPIGTYLASLVIAGMSHWFARIFHEPVTAFFIPGFFTLVPGGGMYRTALAFIQGNMSLGVQELTTTLFTALAIALAVFTVDSFMQIINGQQLPKFVRKNRRLR